MSNQLKNQYTKVEFINQQGHKKIIGGDLTDKNNEPRFYTKNVQGIERAWEEIKQKFGSKTTMSNLIDICAEHKLKPHQYCAVD